MRNYWIEKTAYLMIQWINHKLIVDDQQTLWINRCAMINKQIGCRRLHHHYLMGGMCCWIHKNNFLKIKKCHLIYFSFRSRRRSVRTFLTRRKSRHFCFRLLFCSFMRRKMENSTSSDSFWIYERNQSEENEWIAQLDRPISVENWLNFFGKIIIFS